MFCYLCDLPESENKTDSFHSFKSPHDDSEQSICDYCQGDIDKGSIFYFCDRCEEIKGSLESPLTSYCYDFNERNSNFCKECWDEIEQDRDDNEADRAYQREEAPCQS